MKPRTITPLSCSRVLLAADHFLARRFTKQQELVAEQFAKPYMEEGFSHALQVWADSLLAPEGKSSTIKTTWFAIGAMVLFFIFGLLTQALGAGQSVNVVLNAFMALLVWQGFVLVLGLLSIFLPQTPVIRTDWLQPIFSRLDRHWAKLHKIDDWPRWLKWTVKTKSRLWQIQGQIGLNLAFLAFTAGLLIGMAIRGLAQSYAFHWESTFFHDPDQIQAFLDGLFWPITQLSGVAVPRLGPIHSPMSGREWFLLYAWASLFYLIIPRAVWLVIARVKRGNWTPNWPDEAPFNELRRLWRQESAFSATIHPYSYKINPNRKMTADQILIHLFGPGSQLGWAAGLEWEADADQLTLAEGPNIVLVKGLHTPEKEIHGEFLRHLAGRKAKHPTALWVDLADLPQTQRPERLSAWQTLAKSCGLPCFGVDLDSGSCLDPDGFFAWGQP